MNEIKLEYFELLKLLNKSNKTKNEVTQLTFFVDDIDKKHLELFATISKNQKILLCEKFQNRNWSACKLTQFSNLEEFVAENATTYKLTNFTEFILSRIFELPD